jgi:undecaprenyl pyrophosphate phosphatase UppP
MYTNHLFAILAVVAVYALICMVSAETKQIANLKLKHKHTIGCIVANAYPRWRTELLYAIIVACIIAAMCGHTTSRCRHVLLVVIISMIALAVAVSHWLHFIYRPFSSA